MSNFNASEHVDMSVAIVGIEVKDNIPTEFGDKQALNANVTNLSTGETLEDVLIFNKVLIKQAVEAQDMTVIGTLRRMPTKDNDRAYYAVEAPTTKELLAAARAGI